MTNSGKSEKPVLKNYSHDLHATLGHCKIDVHNLQLVI